MRLRGSAGRNLKRRMANRFHCRKTIVRRWLPAVTWIVLTAAAATAHIRAQDRPPSTAASTEADRQEQTNEPASFAAPLPRGKKLVLTDGSFQIVREYERQGDRVRYYSVERSSWEEIPAELVDWAATDKAGADAAAAQKETLDRIHAAATAEVALSINTGSSLQVGTGVFLPDSPGFYVLDGPTVLGLVQVEATSRIDKGRAVLKGLSGIPFISSKRIIEIPGKQAKIRIHSAEPEFFIRTTDGRTPQLTLVKAEITGDKRHVTTVVTDVTGTAKYDQKEIPVLNSEPARGVQRMVMSRKLEPGEYALLETTSEGLSSYIWEFGVDSNGASQTSKTAPAKSQPR
jgi:hypothetical protein